MTSQDMPDNPGDPAATDEQAADARFTQDATEADGQAAADTDGLIDEALGEGDADQRDAEAEAAEAQLQDGDDELTETERLATELEERTSDLKRLGAEYANYRRRAERDRQATVEMAKAQVAGQLLPINDDLDLARNHGDLEEGPLKTFGEKFASVITGLGVEKFGEPGDEFDPERHEAVQDMSSGDDKVIGTVLRPGYLMGERILRTAMVVIGDPE